jgi:hypothetical protein
MTFLSRLIWQMDLGRKYMKVEFGQNESPVAAVLHGNALDRRVR